MNKKRQTLDDALEKRFVFGDSELDTQSNIESESSIKQFKPGQSSKSTKGNNSTPWDSIEVTQKSATIRLNVDIPVELNDKLADKARQLRKPKTELVRKLLEWALKD